jgi:hypothetical protein
VTSYAITSWPTYCCAIDDVTLGGGGDVIRPTSYCDTDDVITSTWRGSDHAHMTSSATPTGRGR